jgi:hypothetical protein
MALGSPAEVPVVVAVVVDEVVVVVELDVLRKPLSIKEAMPAWVLHWDRALAERHILVK